MQYRVDSSGVSTDRPQDVTPRTWNNGPQNVTTTTTIVTGLDANTPYEAQVRATNDEGVSGWSDPPCEGRTNLSTNNAAEGALTITGTAQVGETQPFDTRPPFGRLHPDRHCSGFEGCANRDRDLDDHGAEELSRA